MILICNLRKEKCNMPYDVRVDRSSILGNPFPMKNEDDRYNVCYKYDKYFDERINKDENFKKELIRIYNIYEKYGKVRLFCWCAPKRCHAEKIRSWLKDYIADMEI